MKRVLRGVGVLVGVLVALVVAFVVYVETTSSSRTRYPDTPMPVGIAASTDPTVIEHGRALAQGVCHCAACHGAYDGAHQEALREDVPLSGGLELHNPFGLFRVPNITSDRETGIGAWSDAEIARVIRTGVRRDGELSVTMGLAVGDLGDDDLAAIVSYLRTLPPVSHAVAPSEPSFLALAFVTFMPIPPGSPAAVEGVPEEPEPSVARGEYLAGIGMCVGCHTPARHDDPLSPDLSRRFSGGDPLPGHDPAHPELEYAPPNLTSDPDTGSTGRMSEEQWLDRFRRIGRTAPGSPMPWENFQRISDGDLRSIYRYVHALPPIRRDVGPHERETGSFAPPP